MLAKEFNECLDVLRNGNSRGLENIYNEYHAKMKLAAFRVLKDYSAAEDVVSHFLKYITEKAKDIKYIDYPDTWIIKAINHIAINYIRKNTKNVNLEDYKNIMYIENNWLRLAFIESFKQLTDAEQKITLLHYTYGYKYKEISIITGKPVGTIKSDISNIKNKLTNLKNF